MAMGNQSKTEWMRHKTPHQLAVGYGKEIFRITNQGEIEVDGKVVNDDATLARLLREFAKCSGVKSGEI